MKSFALISAMTESSSRTWAAFALPRAARLKTRPDKPVSGHAGRAAHYRVNRDARASAARFADLNSQHSLSLVKRDPGRYLPARAVRTMSRPGEVRTRGAATLRHRSGPLLVQATPRRPRSGDIRPPLARRLIPYRRDFYYIAHSKRQSAR